MMKESGGQLRGDRAGKKKEDWGWIDVLSMKGADGKDLKPGASYVQPDGGDPSDETVLSVPLPSPVPPHGEITLDIAFKAKLPKVFARTGFVRDYYLVGQWFPKIGVYEPAGMRQRRIRRLELPLFSRQLGVLRRLRKVRRHVHGSFELHRRRDG